ncbi:TPA: lysostaphin resistance A-like protein [Streptococcus agalactiae]
MVRILVIYGAIHVNVLLLSLFLLGYVDVGILMMLQVAFLAIISWDWIRYGKGIVSLSLKKRAYWLFGSLMGMVSLTLLMSLLFPVGSRNQEILLTVQRQIPNYSFILFLLNASVVEEYVYRQLIWERLKQPAIQLFVTSFLFTLSHHPVSLVNWCIYGGLGLSLGFIRLKTDSLTSTLLHITWNSLVLLLTFL